MLNFICEYFLEYFIEFIQFLPNSLEVGFYIAQRRLWRSRPGEDTKC